MTILDRVADFLYDWQDTGESPTKAAARLLKMIEEASLDDELKRQHDRNERLLSDLNLVQQAHKRGHPGI